MRIVTRLKTVKEKITGKRIMDQRAREELDKAIVQLELNTLSKHELQVIACALHRFQIREEDKYLLEKVYGLIEDAG